MVRILLKPGLENFEHYFASMGFPIAQLVKNLPAMQETRVCFLGREDPLEKRMASHSLQYPCLENPRGRGAWWAPVHGVARVGHNLATQPPPFIEETAEAQEKLINLLRLSGF